MVEFEFWWLLVIPFFFGLGWIAARIDIKQIISAMRTQTRILMDKNTQSCF